MPYLGIHGHNGILGDPCRSAPSMIACMSGFDSEWDEGWVCGDPFAAGGDNFRSQWSPRCLRALEDRQTRLTTRRRVHLFSGGINERGAILIVGKWRGDGGRQAPVSEAMARLGETSHLS